MMKGNVRNRLLSAFAVVVGLGLSALPACADVLILESKLATYPRGTKLADSATIKLPAGASITVVLASGDTRTLTGPFNAKVANLSKGEPVNKTLWNMVQDFVSTGGTSRKNLGITRSALAPKRASATELTWREIPESATGDYCVERGAPLALTREPSNEALTLMVVNIETGDRGLAEFGANDTKISWPKELKPVNGRYAIMKPDKSMREIRLRNLARLPKRDHVLSVLHRQRCNAQFRVWLRELILSIK